MFDISEGEVARALTRRAEQTSAIDVAWHVPARAAAPLGPRILVVEDSLLVADSICDTLQEHGYAVVGPTGLPQEACALAWMAGLAGAVLKLKPGEDELCLPIAMLLKARGIPFVIVTGYPPGLRPRGVDPAAWIAMPMEAAALTEAVARMLARRVGADGAQAEPVVSASRGLIGGVSPSRSAAGLSRAASCRVRVLLVEGDPETRARLAAVLARQGLDVQSFDTDPPVQRAARDGAAPTEKIVCGKLVVDLAQRRAWWDGVEVRLTAGELAIVVLLVSHAGRCVDNRTVYDSLHYKGFLSGQGEKGFWVNVRSAIRRIRNKFRAIDGSFTELENARAFGYRWRTPA